MARLDAPKLSYLNEGESFTYYNRNLPVYYTCDKNDGLKFCVSHRLFLTEKNQTFTLAETETYETHKEHASNHVLVWYCLHHERFEEV